MEAEGLLPLLPMPTTSPYPEPDESSPCTHPTSWRFILILSSHLHPCLSSDLLLWIFLTKRCVHFPSPSYELCKVKLQKLNLKLAFFSRHYVKSLHNNFSLNDFLRVQVSCFLKNKKPEHLITIYNNFGGRIQDKIIKPSRSKKKKSGGIC
jgi:hypothetical protein